MNKKLIRCLSIISSLFILSGILCSCDSSDALEENLAVVEEAAYRDLGENVSVNGTVTGYGEIEVHSGITGIVDEVKVTKGDTVKKGDIICKFSSSEIQSQIEEIKLEIENSGGLNALDKEKAESDLKNAKNIRTLQINLAQSEIDSAQSEYDNAYNNYQTYLQLYNKEIENSNSTAHVSDSAQLNEESTEEEFTEPLLAEEYKNKYTEYYNSLAELKNQLEIAKSNYEQIVLEQDSLVNQAQYEVDKYQYGTDDENQSKLTSLEKQLKQCTVYASKDGVISDLSVEEGKEYLGGEQPVAKISAQSGAEIVMYIEDKDVLSVKRDMIGSISIVGNTKFSTQGKVTDISAVKDTENNGFRAVVTVEQDTLLKIGMSVKVNLFVMEVENALSVSSTAIIKGMENTYSVYVLKSADDGSENYVVEEKNVEIVEGSYEYTQIVSDSISEGDWVITDPIAYEIGEIVTEVEVLDMERNS